MNRYNFEKSELNVSRVNREYKLRDYWSSLFRHFGIKKVFLWVLESLFNMIFSPLPIIGGSFIRKIAYKPLLKKCGRELFTAPGVKFLHSYNIEIGNRCSLSYGTMLNGRGGLIIGDDFTAGPDVLVWTVEHNFLDRDRRVLEQGEYDAPVTIGGDVWCGARAIILPGVEVAEGSVIAAGAVVTKNTEPYSINAGVPAKTIGYRKSRGNPNSD